MQRAFRRSIVVCACILVRGVRQAGRREVLFRRSLRRDGAGAAGRNARRHRDGRLRFESGTFREVFREIPARRTDGIEVMRAEMQGVPLPFGTEAGTVEVRQRNGRVRVVWRFRPVEEVTRTFVLNYRVKGVLRQEGGADLLVWRGTPGEHVHDRTSTLRFELPGSPLRRLA